MGCMGPFISSFTCLVQPQWRIKWCKRPCTCIDCNCMSPRVQSHIMSLYDYEIKTVFLSTTPLKATRTQPTLEHHPSEPVHLCTFLHPRLCVCHRSSIHLCHLISDMPHSNISKLTFVFWEMEPRRVVTALTDTALADINSLGRRVKSWNLVTSIVLAGGGQIQ